MEFLFTSASGITLDHKQFRHQKRCAARSTEIRSANQATRTPAAGSGTSFGRGISRRNVYGIGRFPHNAHCDGTTIYRRPDCRTGLSPGGPRCAAAGRYDPGDTPRLVPRALFDAFDPAVAVRSTPHLRQILPADAAANRDHPEPLHAASIRLSGHAQWTDNQCRSLNDGLSGTDTTPAGPLRRSGPHRSTEQTASAVSAKMVARQTDGSATDNHGRRGVREVHRRHHSNTDGAHPGGRIRRARAGGVPI